MAHGKRKKWYLSIEERNGSKKETRRRRVHVEITSERGAGRITVGDEIIRHIGPSEAG
jgi:hypothetical protein